MLRWIRDDLDRIPIDDVVIKWYDLPVRSRNDEAMSEFRVDRVREVYRRRAFRETDDIPFRSECEDAVIEDIDLYFREQLFITLGALHDILKFRYPIDIFRDFWFPRFAILEVGRDSDLRLFMHLTRSDLYLGRLASEFLEHSYDGRMKTLISVLFRERNVIFEFFWNWRPMGMNFAEDLVTVRYRVGDDAHRKKIMQVTNVLVSAFSVHLFENTICRLDAKADLMDMNVPWNDFGNHLFGINIKIILLHAKLLELTIYSSVVGRVQCAKTLIFENFFKFKDTESISDRCIYIECLERDTFSFIAFHMKIERSHIMDSIGKFDDDDADILTHRDEHFSKTLDRALFSAIFELADLAESSADMRYLVSEFCTDIVDSPRSILRDIMKKARLDRRQIGTQ